MMGRSYRRERPYACMSGGRLAPAFSLALAHCFSLSCIDSRSLDSSSFRRPSHNPYFTGIYCTEIHCVAADNLSSVRLRNKLNSFRFFFALARWARCSPVAPMDAFRAVYFVICTCMQSKASALNNEVYACSQAIMRVLYANAKSRTPSLGRHVMHRLSASTLPNFYQSLESCPWVAAERATKMRFCYQAALRFIFRRDNSALPMQVTRHERGRRHRKHSARARTNEFLAKLIWCVRDNFCGAARSINATVPVN